MIERSARRRIRNRRSGWGDGARATVEAAAGPLPAGSRAGPGVLLLGVAACVTLTATAPSLAWIAGALVLAGLLGSGVQRTRGVPDTRLVSPDDKITAETGPLRNHATHAACREPGDR